MQRIFVSLSQQLRTLNPALISSVVTSHKEQRDLESRLLALPNIAKGYSTSSRIGSPHKNAIDYYTRHKDTVKLYVGYIIYRERFVKEINWNIEVHSFCVEDSHVVEVNKQYDWEKVDAYYVGMPVPEEDITNMAYLNKFSLMSYVRANSPILSR